MTIAECKQVCLDEISRLETTIESYKDTQWHWMVDGCKAKINELQAKLLTIELIEVIGKVNGLWEEDTIQPTINKVYKFCQEHNIEI